MSAIDVDDSELIARLAAMGNAVRDALSVTATALGQQLLDSARAALPAGPLADALDLNIVQLDTTTAAVVGVSLDYAAFVEYGFSGVEQVRESLRIQSMAFGRPMSPRDVLVRAHSRRVDFPGRSYLGASLDDMSGDIAPAYDGAIAAAVGA